MIPSLTMVWAESQLILSRANSMIDPMDTNGHGTHVAGIISASNSPQVIGVAPEAKLLAYKVFSAMSPTTADDILIEAFLKAYDDGADIITASIAGINVIQS